MHTGVYCENLKERDHLEDLGVDEDLLKWTLKKQGESVWTGFI
jgi:hypothetical protein